MMRIRPANFAQEVGDSIGVFVGVFLDWKNLQSAGVQLAERLGSLGIIRFK